jgi:hypothetical protein
MYRKTHLKAKITKLCICSVFLLGCMLKFISVNLGEYS